MNTAVGMYLLLVLKGALALALAGLVAIGVLVIYIIVGDSKPTTKEKEDEKKQEGG